MNIKCNYKFWIFVRRGQKWWLLNYNLHETQKVYLPLLIPNLGGDHPIACSGCMQCTHVHVHVQCIKGGTDNRVAMHSIQDYIYINKRVDRPHKLISNTRSRWGAIWVAHTLPVISQVLRFPIQKLYPSLRLLKSLDWVANLCHYLISIHTCCTELFGKWL